MYSSVESAMDKTLALRAQLKSAGISVSVNDFLIKAVALALKQCPLVNCLYSKDEVRVIKAAFKRVVRKQNQDIYIEIYTFF